MTKQIPFPTLLSALAIAACSAYASVAAAAAFPTGTFASQGLTLTFDDKAHLHVIKGAVTEVEANYTVTGDKIQLTDESGPWACAKTGEQTGSYHWKFENGVLAFSKIADLCGERSNDLTKDTWKMQK